MLGCRAPGAVVGEHLTIRTLDVSSALLSCMTMIERAGGYGVVRRQRLG